jgi:hypothetical protein
MHDAFTAAVTATAPPGFTKARPLWMERQRYQATEPLTSEINDLAAGLPR